jgi:hypothetical protein
MCFFSSIAVLLIVVSGSMGARAQEVNQPSPEQAQEESIATAKQSFETLKKRLPIEERNGTGMTFLAAPEFHLGTPTPTESVKAKTAKPTKNWLVDGAMAKSPANTKDRSLASEDIRRSDSRELNDLAGTSVSDESETATLTEGSDASSRRERATLQAHESSSTKTEAINPLASYMSGWISTQDRALLLPPKGTESTAGALDTGLMNFYATSSPGLSTSVPREGLDGNAAALTNGAQENPYLNSGNFRAPGVSAESAPVGSFQNLAPITPQSTIPILPAQMNEGPPQSANRPAARDLAKPDDNAKYFKQLKRF